MKRSIKKKPASKSVKPPPPIELSTQQLSIAWAMASLVLEEVLLRAGKENNKTAQAILATAMEKYKRRAFIKMADKMMGGMSGFM